MPEDRKPIPTNHITIGKGTPYERKIEVYQWLTEEETEEYTNTITGSNGDIELTSKDLEKDEKELGQQAQDSLSFKLNISQLRKAQRLLVKFLCLDVSTEEFNYMLPACRDELIAKLDKMTSLVTNKKKSN